MLHPTWRGPLRRWLPATVVLLLLAVPTGVVNPSGPTLSRVITFTQGDLHIERQPAGARYSLPGAIPFGAAGEPEVPSLPVTIELPPGQDVSGFELRVDSKSEISTGLAPWPASEDPVAPGTPQSDIYASNDLHPSSQVIYTGISLSRGRRLAMFLVFPLQVKPASGDLVLATHAELIAHLSPAPLGKAEPLVPSSVSPEARHADGALGFTPTDMPSTEGSAVDYVIVCPDAFVPAYQVLAQWKMKKGVRTTIRTLSWVREHYPEGVDLADRVRRFLKDAYQYWGTRWVLIGGDTEQIPIRYAHTKFYHENFIASDLYYSALDGNWNDNGDALFGDSPGRWGESSPGDSVDFAPDVYGGRLPAADLTAAQTMVNKIITYESNPPLSTDYLNRVITFSEVLFPSDWYQGLRISMDGAVMADSTFGLVPGTIHTARLYENYYEFPGSLRESRRAVLDSMNAGYNIWLHIGHGFRNTMAVGGELDNDRLTNEDADALTNGDRLGLLYALNCASAAVDYNCIGERFLVNPRGGAFGVIGSTDLDFPAVTFAYQLEFFKLLYQQGVYHLGEAYYRANEPFIPQAVYGDNADRWTQYAQILLGDPETEIWTSKPRALAATVASTMNLGQTSLQVTVTSSGAPVPGARVCAYKPGDAYAVATTNASGVAVLAVRPDSLGTMYVTALKHDYVPLQRTTTVTAAPAGTPFLIVHGTAITDPAGNGDNAANPGEAVDITITAQNRGTAASGAVTATLTSGSSDATILQGSTTIPSMDAGASAPAASAFRILVAPTVKDLQEIPLTVLMTAGASWSQQIVVPVQAPLVQLMHTAVFDTVGGANGNGVLEPGESADVVMTLLNLGHGAARNVSAVMRSVGGGVSVPDSTGSIAEIAAGASASITPAFRITVAPDSVPSARILMSDAGGLALARRINFTPPAAPDSLWTAGASSSITLNWRPPQDTDVAGYFISRSTSSSGPFTRLNAELDAMAYYKDEQLPTLSRFYYQVATVDSSGGTSAPSSVIAASTSVPLMSGWPVQYDGDANLVGAAIEDLDSATTNDGSMEIVTGGGHLHVMEPDGREYIDGDGDAITLGIFSSRGHEVWSEPAIADIDRDHSKEIVVQSWGSRQSIARDESLFVYNGTFGKVKWARPIQNYNWGSPAIGNIDADANYEIVAAAGGCVYAWNHNGTEVRDGDGDPNTNGVFAVLDSTFALYGSPALANISGDAREEIIVAERKYGVPDHHAPTTNKLHVFLGTGVESPGFPKTIGFGTTSSPAVANLDGLAGNDPDHRNEIVIASGDSVYVFHSDGTPMVGGPPRTPGIYFSNFTDFMSSPAIGDINRDGKLDIVIGSHNGLVYAWTASTGQMIPGWPVQLAPPTDGDLGSPVIANLDGDPELEVLISDYKGNVWGLNDDGSLLEGWPYKTGNAVYGSPLVWDVDGDGKANVVITSSDQNIYVLDLQNAPFDPNDTDSHPWPKFRHDARNSGTLPSDMFLPVALGSFSAVHRGDGLVNLSWQATSEFAEFHVYRQPEGGLETLAGSVGGRNGDGYISYSFDDRDVPEGRYFYTVAAVKRAGGEEERFGPLRVDVARSGLPVVAELLQNSPNPFKVTAIRYRVPASLGKTPLTLRVYDVSGRLVTTLVNGPQTPGDHVVTWDGRDGEGRRLASGLYFYRLEGGDVSITRKMSLLQ